MNKEWKDRWISALRSGAYIQNRGALMKDGRYCALGVLVDIFGGFQTREPYASILEITSNAERQNIIILNDMRGIPFNQIAVYIEEHL